MELPKKKYDVIVIDPPWQVKKLTRKARYNQVNMDYKMMSLEEIEKMPIDSIAKDNSWLFLWTTQKFLFDSKKILEKWGFEYFLLMTWKKTYGISEGMPLFGFRWNSEFILVGRKGKKDVWIKGKPLIKTCFEGVNKKHSQKPTEFYEMIRVLDGEKIDIFARQRHEGFDAWGDEVDDEKQITLNNERHGANFCPTGGLIAINKEVSNETSPNFPPQEIKQSEENFCFL